MNFKNDDMRDNMDIIEDGELWEEMWKITTEDFAKYGYGKLEEF